MHKVVTGEHVARLYNPDPFARPVWRAPVYITPAWIIAIAQLLRLLAWLVRMTVRHPVAAFVLALLAFTWVSTGWVGLAGLVVWAVLVLAIWRHFWPSSFTRWVAASARGKWRAWFYRRRWAGVIAISGVAPWYQGRIWLPVLGKVTATRYVDRAHVRLVSGQRAADFARRTDNLADGFGALRLRLVRDLAGRPGRRPAVKDGARTHGHGGGGLSVAVVIGAGVALAMGVAEAIARVWPYLVAGMAVIAGLWAAGWVTHAVMIYRLEREAWQAVRPAVRGVRCCPSPFLAGEDLQEEQEHVQYVKEDRRGQQRRGADVL
jgi:hypothetical protein